MHVGVYTREAHIGICGGHGGDECKAQLDSSEDCHHMVLVVVTVHVKILH